MSESGLANGSPAWTYDAAWNRSSDSTNPGTWTYDNRNRLGTAPGLTYTNDILGNRLSQTTSGGVGLTTNYTWDCLNRLTTYTQTSALQLPTSYTYRADGMRVGKVNGNTGTSTAYRCDGQMGFEDVDMAGTTVSTVTDYGVGARGIDYVAATTPSGTAVGFPVYDAHANMVACLFRFGTNYYSVGNQRSYDAWGNLRQGSPTGDPKGRYCAALGRKQDDESGLIYMRARYYESSSGRFLSEDSDPRHFNRFAHCSDQPITRIDEDGHGDGDWSQASRNWCIFWCLAGTGQYAAAVVMIYRGALPTDKLLAIAAILICGAACCFAAALSDTSEKFLPQNIKEFANVAAWVMPMALAIAAALTPAKANGFALTAITAMGACD